jgi:ubiquitin thioesterase OTU1
VTKFILSFNFIIANLVASKFIFDHPADYSEAILGKRRQDYMAWLQEPNTWGGAIELAIFAEYFETEILSIDILSLRMDRFGILVRSLQFTHFQHTCNLGENFRFSKRVFLLFNGVHYDVLVRKIAMPHLIQTVFSTADDEALAEALSIAESLFSVRISLSTLFMLVLFFIEWSICQN